MNRTSDPAPRLVRLRVDAAGRVSVTVDGTALLPVDGAWGRESFAAVLDLASDQRSVAVQVEVQEADGAVFTGSLPAVGGAARRRTGGSCVGDVAASGFLPGEDVAVGVVVMHVLADESGAVDIPPHWPLAAGPGDLVLFGRATGTLHIAARA